MKNKLTFLSLICSAVFSLETFAINDALKIRIARGSYSDEAVVRFLEGATAGFDGSYDAWKLFSSNASVPNIFTKIVSVGDLAINALPSFTASVTTDVFLKIGTAGTYTISAEELGAFSEGVKIVMKDLVTGLVYDLRGSATYTVSLPVIAQTAPARFQVLFSYPAAAAVTNATCMVCQDGTVSLTKAGEASWQYAVLNESGNTVSSGTASASVQNITSLAKGNYTVTITGSISYSENKLFSVGVSPILLGATFVEFTAREEKGAVMLSWTTGMESNTSYFSVERSEDGINYQSIEHVAAAGNSSAARMYNVSDLAPKGEKVFYQLKLVDLNGTLSYSEVLPVALQNNLSLSIFPVPVSQAFNVRISDSKNAEIMIVLRDIQGREVLRSSHTLASDTEIIGLNVPPICSPGTYILAVSGQHVSIIEKIIIN